LPIGAFLPTGCTLPSQRILRTVLACTSTGVTMTQPANLAPPRTTRHLDDLRRLAAGDTPQPAVARLIGFVIEHIDLGRSIVTLDTTERHANPMGTLHGGILCDVADAAMGIAFATTLEDDETFTTLDLACKFFKPIWTAHLTATAYLVKRTRTLGLLECDITDDTGSLVAKLYSTCMVLRGQAATGR
jgi:uncharacterized protein (TIGR00369 family)